MGFNSSSGVTSVTGNVTSVQSQHEVLVLQGVPDNQTLTIGTVPANQKWHIVGMACVGVCMTSGDVLPTIALNDVVFYAPKLKGLTTYGSGQFAGTVNFDYYTCPTLSTGQTVKFQNTTLNGIWMAVYYSIEVV
jgi:hypothetical protein